VTITEPPAPGDQDKTLGWITPSFEQGALLLADDEGRFFRLSWGELDKEAGGREDKRRALPAGKYVLAGYRIVERDADKAEWHVSATARKIRSVRVEAGVVQRIEIDATIRIGKRLKGKKIAMQIRGQRAGLSIYKQGRRIPIGYRLNGAGGDVLVSGAMRYG